MFRLDIFQYVPLLVQLCVKVVEAHGMDTVGIYRIPGNTAAVNALMAGLDRGFEYVCFFSVYLRFACNSLSALLGRNGIGCAWASLFTVAHCRWTFPTRAGRT